MTCRLQPSIHRSGRVIPRRGKRRQDDPAFLGERLFFLTAASSPAPPSRLSGTWCVALSGIEFASAILGRPVPRLRSTGGASRSSSTGGFACWRRWACWCSLLSSFLIRIDRHSPTLGQSAPSFRCVVVRGSAGHNNARFRASRLWPGRGLLQCHHLSNGSMEGDEMHSTSKGLQSSCWLDFISSTSTSYVSDSVLEPRGSHLALRAGLI